MEPTALFQQRRSEVVGREPVHDDNHRAARNEALFDDAGIPVAKALLLELRGDLIRLHRVVDDRQFGAEARDGSAHRRRQALPTLRGGQEVLGELGEHRPGEDSTIETRRHHAPRQTRQLARQVVPVADAKNAFRRLDAQEPGREKHRDGERLHMSGRQVEDEALLSAVPDRDQRLGHQVHVGRRHHLLAVVQLWKHQNGEDAEVQAREPDQIVDAKRRRLPVL